MHRKRVLVFLSKTKHAYAVKHLFQQQLVHHAVLEIELTLSKNISYV